MRLLLLLLVLVAEAFSQNASGSIFTLANTTVAATTNSTSRDVRLHTYDSLLIELVVTSAERDSANETYDIYVWAESPGGTKMDLAHFPQVATTGAKKFLARVSRNISPAKIDSGTPTTTVDKGTLTMTTDGSGDGWKTLSAGQVRHGPWGHKIGYSVVVAGTVTTGIAFSINVVAK